MSKRTNVRIGLLIATALILTMVLSAVSPVFPMHRVIAAEPIVGLVTAGQLNVRSGPGTTYPVIAVLQQFEQVTLIGRNSTASWVQVRLVDGTVGWCSSRYIDSPVPFSSLPLAIPPAPPGVPSTIPVTTAPPPGSGPLGMTLSARLNVRSGPSVGYSVIAILVEGQQVALIGRNPNGTWLQVRLNDSLTGWVNAAYIRTSAVINSLPVTGEYEPWGVVTTGALNVRSAPSFTASVILTASEGQGVGLLGRSASGQWIKVRINSQIGWASASGLTTSVPISSLPVVAN